LTPGKTKELAEIAADRCGRGADVEEFVGRPTSEAACEVIVAKAMERLRPLLLMSRM
jgi:hypothetical protein